MNRRNNFTQRLSRFCLILGVLLFALWVVIPVRAHANLVHSEPTAGAVLAESPPAVVLEFSEALDTGATAVELLDADGDVVVAGPGEIDPAQPTHLHLALPSLPDGTYNAVWQARSAVDGHVTWGTVAFSVGLETLPPSLLPPPGTPLPATAVPETANALSRWLNYLAATVAVGSLLFGWLVWRPAFRRWSASSVTADAQTTHLLQRLAVVGSVAWALATILFILMQARQLESDSFTVALQAILDGRTGWLAAARLGLLLLLVILARRLPLAGNGRLAPWLLVSALGTAALFTFSLQSHSAALAGSQSAVAILLDWLHLLAMVAWLGGLLPLALLLWPKRMPPGLATVLIPAFSKIALPCVLILVLTGLYSARLHVQTADALTMTTHGRALSLKLGLFAILLALGALNLLLFSPRLKRVEERAAHGLRYTVRLELWLGTAVLLAVGVMTAVAPAFEALEAQQRLGFRESVQMEDVELSLHIAPLHVGDNEFAVDVVDGRPGASDVIPAVLLRFSHQDEGMGTLQVETHTADNQRFSTRGSYLSLVGAWQIEVIVRREGFKDVKHTFHVTVEPASHPHH